VAEDPEPDLAEDMDRVSIAGVTDVIVGCKRRAEEVSSTVAVKELMRKKVKVHKEAQSLVKEWKVRNEEKKRLDAAMDEIMQEMSQAEMAALVKAALVESDDERTSD
jgi:LEA14-like dessication related protein